MNNNLKHKRIEYIPLIFDLTFKYIFGYQKNIRFTEYILEILLKKEQGYFKDKLIITNSYCLEKKHIYEKGKELDISILLPDNSIINMEAYSSYFGTYAKRKSLMYESASYSNELNVGNKISNSNVKRIKQFNFVKGFHLPFQEYGIIGINEPHDELLEDEFRLNVIDIDQHEVINYNNDIRLNELLEFMGAKTKEEALTIVNKYNRKELKEMENEMEKFFDYDAWMIEAFSKERWADAIREDEIRHIKNEAINEGYTSGMNDGYTSGMNDGYTSGMNEAIFKTAKNMLKDNINIKLIMKYTGLTKKEIQKLNKAN